MIYLLVIYTKAVYSGGILPAHILKTVKKQQFNIASDGYMTSQELGQNICWNRSARWSAGLGIIVSQQSSLPGDG